MKKLARLLKLTITSLIIMPILLISTITMAQNDNDTGVRILAKAYDQEGIFCNYYESESGDSPDQITIIIRGESFNFDAAFDTREEYIFASRHLKPGDLIYFNIIFRSYYDESRDGDRSAPGIIGFNPVKNIFNDPSACKK
jgi:hypothetical protein